MYIPKRFNMEDDFQKISFIKKYNFASLISINADRLVATHLPFIVREENGTFYLVSHLAKANPQSNDLDGQSCLVIFTGPHAYISPSHYDREESVPTWDYLAVHAYGKAEVLPDNASKVKTLEAMIQFYEPTYQAQWAGLSDKFKEGMLQGLEAFRIPIEELQGQQKLSQNKSTEEKQRIVDNLSHSQYPEEQALSNYIRESL